MTTLEKYIEEANKIHDNKYDYSKFVYTRKIDKSIIICPIHGEFEQSMHSHLKGQGCPKCGLESRSDKRRDDKDSFIKKAREIHGDKYDYSEVEYVNNKTKVKIICPEHGEFWQRPDGHLNGRACPYCANVIKRDVRRSNTEDFINKAKEIHGDRYDYSKVKYVNNSTPVCIICPKHGEFYQTPSSHLMGKGCSECGKEDSIKKRTMTTEEFIAKAKEVHGNRYDYSKTEYRGIYKNVTIICPKHGEFKQRASYHLSGNGCQKCANDLSVSNGEIEILDFIRGIYDGEVMHGNRNVLDNGYELDIYLPALRLAFEFDGLYWHNEINKKDKNYHLKKTKQCEEKKIRLIHIFEDEWRYKKDIVKSRIKSLLKISDRKIGARSCEIVEVDNDTSKAFLNENHIQGNCISKIRYGLVKDGELVALMTFGCGRKNLNQNREEGEYELLRFCNKCGCNVIGGASRLFKHFLKEHNPKNVISYADKRWSNGDLYDKLGFVHKHDSQPSYFYVINDKRENRFKYRKDALVREGFDKDKSEHQIMMERKIYRIYDCGCKVYSFSL